MISACRAPYEKWFVWLQDLYFETSDIIQSSHMLWSRIIMLRSHDGGASSFLFNGLGSRDGS